MLRRILIANRGEIALRIARTCREMKIETVAVYADVDCDSPPVRACDLAVALGGRTSRETYLHVEKIVAAAKDSGAEAIHPGYGFLSENAEFAAACERAGVVFIGPPSSVLRAVGDKIQARRLATAVQVPIIPGTPGGQGADLLREVERIGYPVMVKASAGGGGKGMRRVDQPQQLPEALERAASEAQSAFGDGSLFLEKCLVEPRHVEVQILADGHGNVVHLGERECSIQRRHQKIIEESPSPAVSEELRAQLGEAAVRLAHAASYRNAGTVEFLLAADGQFYFMEVNARLQVEHPVTEWVTGLDLVEQQIRIACGERLGFGQCDVVRRGHALECRLYAEDPLHDFLPSPGRIALLREPGGPGVRFDCGVESGSAIPLEFDPILAKLSTYGATRDKAIARMARALGETVVLGVRTPLELLRAIVTSEPFVQGKTHTSFLERHFGAWRPDPIGEEDALLGYLIATQSPARQATPSGDAAAQADPWRDLRRFRLSE